MRSQTTSKILEKTPEIVKRKVSLYSDIQFRIHFIVSDLGLTEKDAKEGSQLYNWFKGQFSFELNDIIELECELDKNILTINNK